VGEGASTPWAAVFLALASVSNIRRTATQLAAPMPNIAPTGTVREVGTSNTVWMTKARKPYAMKGSAPTIPRSSRR
jgi:hypothetical protein